jgi:hypothetical protein
LAPGNDDDLGVPVMLCPTVSEWMDKRKETALFGPA